MVEILLIGILLKSFPMLLSPEETESCFLLKIVIYSFTFEVNDGNITHCSTVFTIALTDKELYFEVNQEDIKQDAAKLNQL